MEALQDGTAGLRHGYGRFDTTQLFRTAPGTLLLGYLVSQPEDFIFIEHEHTTWLTPKPSQLPLRS